MTRILIAANIKEQHVFNDLLYRLYHHFSFIEDVSFVCLRESVIPLDKTAVPPYFAKSYDIKKFNNFKDRVKFKTIQNANDLNAFSKGFKLLLIYQEEFYKKNHLQLKSGNPKIYWCDPSKTRQEGSNFIQCALDRISVQNKLLNEDESKEKFKKMQTELKGAFNESVLLATGPSIENFRDFDLKNKLAIACNSTILNKELMQECKPKILVFADPIFHFGVSRYADEFREMCKEFLTANEAVKIVIPIKYYALLKALFKGFEERIIGVPFTKHSGINLELSEKNFYTYTTSNILTLLLLPLATSLTKVINLIGCDGRPLDQDDYFWGHGKSVQINSQMSNIQDCHPGFFKIDYNEYYFQHCHTLDNLINYSESKGYEFNHLGESHIPTLNERSTAPNLSLKWDLNSCKHILIEPDGVSESSGHYINWHSNLAASIEKKNGTVEIWCNKKSEYHKFPSKHKKVFEVNSWALQRSNGATNPEFNFPAFKKFLLNLKVALRKVVDEDKSKSSFHLYMYYGSVQAIKCFQELEKEFPNLKLFFTICVFSESVAFDPKRPLANFHPAAGKVLMEAAAKKYNYRILSVTEELSETMFNSLEVKAASMLHPVIKVDETLSVITAKKVNSEKIKIKDKIVLGIPTRLGHGKSSEDFIGAIAKLCNKHKNIEVRIRKSAESSQIIKLLENAAFSQLIEVDSPEHEDYVSNLLECDVILIPYPQESFYARTSGILYDSILIGKPVITLNNTWLSRASSKYKSGLFVCSISPESIVSALSIIMENYDFFENNLQLAREDILKNSTFDSLAEQIFTQRLNQFSQLGNPH